MVLLLLLSQMGKGECVSERDDGARHSPQSTHSHISYIHRLVQLTLSRSGHFRNPGTELVVNINKNLPFPSRASHTSRKPKHVVAAVRLHLVLHRISILDLLCPRKPTRSRLHEVTATSGTQCTPDIHSPTKQAQCRVPSPASSICTIPVYSVKLAI